MFASAKVNSVSRATSRRVTSKSSHVYFFKIMVKLFLKHVLGVGVDHRGVYGDTAAYYGTLEQQGRLTLHLHMLIWIKNSLTPQEIRDCIKDPNSDFQQRMVEYLESVHVGEFVNGTMVDVSEKVKKKEEDPSYVNPTMIMSRPAAPPCTKHGSDHMVDCESCIQHDTWIKEYTDEVNNIVFRSNIHGHNEGCGFVKTGTCKARFPRQTFPHTTVDPETGALNMKKGEAWLNTYTPVLSYLLRCNSDITSLLSGTAIKSVISYVTDYITKTPLKTHTMFDAIRRVFDKNSEMLLSDSSDRKQKARSILTKIVNTLTASSEIGGPMAAMYLLNHNDHYTSHKFRICFWRTYVSAVRHAWEMTCQKHQK